MHESGCPWWSCTQDYVLPIQGPRLISGQRTTSPCHNWKFPQVATKDPARCNGELHNRMNGWLTEWRDKTDAWVMSENEGSEMISGGRKCQEENAVTRQWNPLYRSGAPLNAPREGNGVAGGRDHYTGRFWVSLLPLLLVSVRFLDPLSK